MPPAARAADPHTCPESDPLAHVGGPVLEGEQTVIVAGQAQARVGDKARCWGAADVIADGCPTVLVAGKMAAREGDPTEHGGKIARGEATVLIGRPRAEGAALRGGQGEAGTGAFDCRGKPLFLQEKPFSCAEAAARMAIVTKTCLDVAEETLRNESQLRGPPWGYDELNGTGSPDINFMLSDHGVTPGTWQLATADNIRSAVGTGNPAIMLLREPNHFVVVDGIAARPDGEYLLIRDPAYPGQKGCREIKIGGEEWQKRVVDPNDATTSQAHILRILS
jgi:uncharacterized Zn-binding protein involved in type VI secretion